ncbi:MAG: glycosyltransferase family 2 protein [Nitrososphaerota archaeon]
MSIAIIILTLNEIDGIKIIAPRVKKEWADEIVFVDGGSTDGTVEEAKKLGFKVTHQTNKGSGNACRIGVEKTNSDYVIFFHPDGNHVPEDIPKLIEKMHDGYDIVHISRFGKNSINEDASTLDIFGNKMFTFLVNVFFGGHLTDALTGLILIKKEIMLDLKTDAQYFEIEEQMCIRALKKNYPIYEIESNEPKRIGGKTKVRPLNVGLRLSWTIIKEFIFWKF